MYQKILLAADGSENSIRAGQQAAQIASLSEGAIVEILFVMDFSKVRGEVLRSQSGEALELERRKKILPIEELFKQANVTSKVTLLHGDPGPTIVDYANKQSCDMVVIGSRGLNKLQEFVLGSVSHKVAKRVNCPVLLVK